MNEKKIGDFALNSFQNAVDKMLNNLKIDISRMSTKDIKRLISDFRVRLIELEIENEKLQRTQVDLSDSHNHYAQLFDYAPVGYFVLNDNGVIIEANLTFTRMLGIVRMELVGRLLIEYIHPNDLHLFEEFIQGFSKNLFKKNLKVKINNTFGEYSLVEFQGNVSHNNESGMEICIAVIESQEPEEITDSIKILNQQLDDQIAQVIVTNQDLQKNIKELAISKKIILEREARLNSIFNAAIEGIITIDDCGKIVSINNAVQSIFGYSEDELMGEMAINLLYNNDKHQQSRSLLGEYVLDGKNIVSKVKEIEGKHKDGSLIPIDISVAEFNIGEKSYFTGILRDVSERKIKEQKDKEHLDELAHVTRLGLMGEMASGIAHELNQPLTAISSYLKACLMITDSTDPGVNILMDTMQKANHQTLMAGQIIHRMRDFVKSRKMQKAAVDINFLVDEAMMLCEVEFKQYGIICKKELELVLPSIEVDKIHIEQVLLNLMKNSAEALSRLPQDIQRILVVQTYLDNQNQIEVRIKDNGPGLDENERHKILKPFFTTKESGMGMGLSISRSIIEAHEGFLRFNSKKGKGSTFYFTLPIAA